MTYWTTIFGEAATCQILSIAHVLVTEHARVIAEHLTTYK